MHGNRNKLCAKLSSAFLRKWCKYISLHLYKYIKPKICICKIDNWWNYCIGKIQNYLLFPPKKMWVVHSAERCTVQWLEKPNKNLIITVKRKSKNNLKKKKRNHRRCTQVFQVHVWTIIHYPLTDCTIKRWGCSMCCARVLSWWIENNEIVASHLGVTKLNLIKVNVPSVPIKMPFNRNENWTKWGECPHTCGTRRFVIMAQLDKRCSLCARLARTINAFASPIGWHEREIMTD